MHRRLLEVQNSWLKGRHLKGRGLLEKPRNKRRKITFILVDHYPTLLLVNVCVVPRLRYFVA